mgnify:CR=1 FL=1|jgi:SAM-dependent methyltransferase
MRESNLHRLNTTSIRKNAPDYIVMHFLIRDLKKVIVRYGRGKVLDVGCGNKPYQSLFNVPAENYIGCDLVQSSDQRVDVICPATAIDLPNSAFDTVFSTQVMEHVDNTELMMQECHRVLKNEGILILSVPFCWELHEEPHDYFRFTKYGLQELCKRSNFEVIEILPNGGKWAALFQMNVNILYSTFRSKKLVTRCLKFLFINLHFTSLINRLGVWLDTRFFDSLLTLNYVLVAKKMTNIDDQD